MHAIARGFVRGLVVGAGLTLPRPGLDQCGLLQCQWEVSAQALRFGARSEGDSGQAVAQVRFPVLGHRDTNVTSTRQESGESLFVWRCQKHEVLRHFVPRSKDRGMLVSEVKRSVSSLCGLVPRWKVLPGDQIQFRVLGKRHVGHSSIPFRKVKDIWKRFDGGTIPSPAAAPDFPPIQRLDESPDSFRLFALGVGGFVVLHFNATTTSEIGDRLPDDESLAGLDRVVAVTVLAVARLFASRTVVVLPVILSLTPGHTGWDELAHLNEHIPVVVPLAVFDLLEEAQSPRVSVGPWPSHYRRTSDSASARRAFTLRMRSRRAFFSSSLSTSTISGLKSAASIAFWM